MSDSNTKKTNPYPAKAQVTECHLLVPLNKSKKLSQLLASNSPPAPSSQGLVPVKSNKQDKFKAETFYELQKAQKLIDDKMTQLLNNFPETKKNKLFIIRFGTIGSIKAMPIPQAFKVLGINNNTINMRLIAGYDYYGNKTQGPP